MMCLLESHDMVGFIDGTLKKPKKKNFPKKEAVDMAVIKGKWKRSDVLIKGWIFGSLCDDVMCNVIDCSTANDVWIKLKTIYSSLESAAPTTTIENDDQAKHLPLYRAILKDDWKKAEEIFKKDENALMFKLNDGEESPLHVAIGTCTNIHFVEKLLEKINPESLPTMVNTRKMNPLHQAAFVGNTRAANMLVEKNPNLLFLPDGKDGEGCLPILRAILGSHKETFSYLLDVTNEHIVLSEQANCQNPFEGNNGSTLFKKAIGAGLWDAAYELIKKYPEMATNISWGSTNTTTLEYIAGKLGVYLSEKPYNRYQRFVYSHVPLENHDVDKGLQHPDIENQDTHRVEFVSEQTKSCFHLVVQRIYDRFWNVALQHVPHIKQLQEEKVRDNKARVVLKCVCEEVSKLNSYCKIRKHYLKAITIAVEHDNLEAVEEIIGYFPQAISTNDNDYPLIHLAIMHRCERVYNFLVHRVTFNKHSQKVWTDENRNNLLHFAGMLAPIHKLNQVSGAALQMQRELQWFQEVKRIACPWHKKSKNNKQEKPIMTFRREHKELRKEGEDWMKKTADSYTITAALIITIVFAAAITVPGGTDGNTGKAIYVMRPSFIIFAVSDAISLFTSTTSLLLFLSILTARYAEKDFLYKLPKRLIFGLAMLFLSVTSMMVAFSATLYLMFGQGKAWILIPIATLTCLPIASFVTLQLPLLADLVSSTYGHGIFQKESDTRIK